MLYCDSIAKDQEVKTVVEDFFLPKYLDFYDYGKFTKDKEAFETFWQNIEYITALMRVYLNFLRDKGVFDAFYLET